MRFGGEDDEDEFDEEQEEDEDDMMDQRANGTGYAEEEAEEENMNFNEDEGSGDDEEEGEGEGDDDDDDDEEDEEGEGDANEDDNEDEDEDDDEDEDEDEQDGEDVDMEGEGSSHTSVDAVKDRPLPPHLTRRSIFVPGFTSPPSSVSIEAIVAIPLPTPVYSLATTTCSSYLLTGGADGRVRAYDFWASINGKQMMTAQQRTLVGLGDVTKAGVARGWWSNEVDGITNGAVDKRMEPVYSMAVEGDGLWSLTGTQSGPINLYTLRHSPGHLVHSLKGHTNVVSCMTLLPGEKGFLSGSWDGTVREWDLNTGSSVRQYPTHGAQISSLALRPIGPLSPSPSPSPRPQINDQDGEGDGGTGLSVSITAGPDFDKPRKPDGTADSLVKAESGGDKDGGASGTQDVEPDALAEPKKVEDGDVAMSDAPSDYDPLFDDDAEGETVPPSGNVTVPASPGINDMALPPSSPVKPVSSGLALPGMNGASGASGSSGANGVKNEQPPSSAAPSSATTPLFSLPQPVASSSRQAASSIPLLSATTYKAFSDDVFLTSSMDGQVVLTDRRVPDYEGSRGVGRLLPGEKTGPWCMSACWSGNGNQVFAGRRNGTVDVWDVRRSSSSTSPNVMGVLRIPIESGPVSCVIGLPDGRHVATASQDNVRLWNTYDYLQSDDNMAKRRNTGLPPFKIIAGHHGGTMSSMIVDPTCRFLITASGDRGWQGESSKVVLIHEIKY